MKGVLAGIAPTARVVDLTHQIEPGMVDEAGFQLAAAAPYFPLGTIHVAVVDPGVGTSRRILCARSARATYLAPDNGLLTRVLEEDTPVELVSVERQSYFLPHVSDTFHGRDIFAPVAGHLANGLDIAKLGPPAEGVVRLHVAKPKGDDGQLVGEIVSLDRFGNLITNIPMENTPPIEAATVGETRIEGPVCRAYAERTAGALVLVAGSSGRLEISVNGGSAQVKLKACRGDPVRVHLAGRRIYENASH